MDSDHQKQEQIELYFQVEPLEHAKDLNSKMSITPLLNHATESKSENDVYAASSDGSFLLPTVPPMLPQISVEKIQNSRKLMHAPVNATPSIQFANDQLNTPNMTILAEIPNSLQGFSTPTSSGTEEILRRSSSTVLSPFPDNFPLSGPSKYICGPPGGTPFPRYKETSPCESTELLCNELKKEMARPPVLNLTEVDFDSIPIIWDTSSEYEMGVPPVPFNTPVTPDIAETQRHSVASNADMVELSFSTSHTVSRNIDLNDEQLMTDLYEAAAKQEKEEKRKQILEKHDKQRIVTREHSLDELLKEMPGTKENIIAKSSYTNRPKGKDNGRTNRSIPKHRPSNKYNDLSLDEVEKLSYERRQAMEYKGAMSIAEKETARRERINGSLSILRKIIPTVTDSTENTEVFEITARYVAFLKRYSEGKHDRGYLYEHLEL